MKGKYDPASLQLTLGGQPVEAYGTFEYTAAAYEVGPRPRPLTDDDLIECVKQIRFTGAMALLGVRAILSPAPLRLSLHCLVPDRNAAADGARIGIGLYEHVRPEWRYSREVFLKVVHKLLHRLIAHETSEGFMFGNERPFDPHKI